MDSDIKLNNEYNPDSNEIDFIEEDKRIDVIKKLTDPEEITATQELLEEKYDAPEEETASEEAEPKKPEDTSKVEDTSGESKDKTETKTDEELKKPEGDKGFILTDEVIQKQPENVRDILNKYKDKGKDDLAKATAHAIAAKTPYLKDDETAISAITEKIKVLSDDELLKALIDTQKVIGVNEQPDKPKEEVQKPAKVELPEIPDTEEFKQAMNSEVYKKLKKKYPDMPEFNSDEFKDWEVDFKDRSGLIGEGKFVRDFELAENEVKGELQKVIYAQTGLKNLWVESPTEILPILNEANLPKLKDLNDNFVEVNNKALQEEVETIKEELEKYGVTEKDLGIDMTLTKDKNGSLYNEYLNSLMFAGDQPDPNVIKRIGKVPLLSKGQLAEKLIYKNNLKIMNFLVDNKAKNPKQKLKD